MKAAFEQLDLDDVPDDKYHTWSEPSSTNLEASEIGVLDKLKCLPYHKVGRRARPVMHLPNPSPSRAPSTGTPVST